MQSLELLEELPSFLSVGTTTAKQKQLSSFRLGIETSQHSRTHVTGWNPLELISHYKVFAREESLSNRSGLQNTFGEAPHQRGWSVPATVPPSFL